MGDVEVIDLPSFEDLVADLLLLRREGIVELRRLPLTALARAVLASGRVDVDRKVEAPAMESLLRQAIDDLGGGRWGDAANVMYGLRPESRGDRPSDLRREAAEAFGCGFSRWRNHWERRVVEQIAEQALRACDEHQMRLTHLALERRAPASSRLAIAWVQRFEAYYALWTPIYALGADLSAYRSTLLEEDRPYDREPSPDQPDGYSQESQAAGYASYALYYFAAYLAGLESFKTTHGGLWLLSDKQSETDVSDAVARIAIASPFNEQDDSYLRLAFSGIKGELHPFRARCRSDSILEKTHAEWQEFAETCQCRWEQGAPDRGYFRTHRTCPGIDPGCQLHAIVTAANDYCVLIDDDWDRIADWYHIGQRRDRGANPEELYLALRKDSLAKGIRWWPPWERRGSLTSLSTSDETKRPAWTPAHAHSMESFISY